MNRRRFAVCVALLAGLAASGIAFAQPRPYIGFAYPAGGQVGTTVQIRVGGQNLDDVNAMLVTGSGVSARISEYYRRLNNQEVQLLNEQLKELKRSPAAPGEDPDPRLAKIERRLREWVQTPACASISSLAFVEVTIAPDAAPGPREVRLATPRGVSNPLVFEIGQVPEHARKPMVTATIQVLGKEAGALRKRPPAEIEEHITLPCTVNGQIASGEVNRYRFHATAGQHLVIATHARQLIPFIADAVPGWIQPVLVLLDAHGREIAYSDDYRFQPDPVIIHDVSQDGEYVLEIHDGLYRGREDFVYRITLGELPFVTSVFPLGATTGAACRPRLAGVNFGDAICATPSDAPGWQWLVTEHLGQTSNAVPFVRDTWPEAVEEEPNDLAAGAQLVQLPIVINGRIGRSGDWDIYRFMGRAQEEVVVEVQARRLDSPLDSIVKLTAADGRVIAFNDDREEVGAGINTHAADSYLMARLPADGAYYVHLGDTAHQGGPDYGYRLRISQPQPDFELRVVPSSVSVPINSSTGVLVYALRKDGFAGPIKLALKDPPAGFTAAAVTLGPKQSEARLNLKAPATPTGQPARLTIVGTATVADHAIEHEAIAAEDRMQAFLWRQLVPARDLQVVSFDRNYEPPPARVPPPRKPLLASTEDNAASAATSATKKPKFTKQQITNRLRELKRLYAEGLLTDGFYEAKVAECDVAP